ncbi:MAG: Capsule biosynthesis protein CapB [Legionellaceae bacterium]
MPELSTDLVKIVQSYGFIIAILLLIITHLTVEALLHLYHLRKIPIRIHVNGSQGKSTITRLITAGLQKAGFIACGKTAGAIPCFIRPDGTEQAIYRSSGNDIMELTKIIRTAANYKPHALIISCSTTKPQFQSLAELKFIKSTHGVISNILDKNLTSMGPTRADVALAFAGAIPVKKKLFTAEVTYLPILSKAAKDRSTEIIQVTPECIASINEEILKQFSYIEYPNHPENIAIALKVCEDLGVPQHLALQGMFEAAPDPEATTIHLLEWEGQPIIFVNAFAINNEIELTELWDILSKNYPDCQQRIILFNCRENKKTFSNKCAKMINNFSNLNQIYILGGGINSFISNLNPNIPSTTAIGWQPITILNHIEKINNENNNPIFIMGMGNITGVGFKIFEYFTHIKHTNKLKQSIVTTKI